jgi:hypothetical protein
MAIGEIKRGKNPNLPLSLVDRDDKGCDEIVIKL